MEWFRVSILREIFTWLSLKRRDAREEEIDKNVFRTNQ